LGLGDFSFACWFKSSVTSSQSLYWKRQTTESSAGFDFRTSVSGKLLLDMADGVDRYFSAASNVITDGNWHHVAVTVDRDNESNIAVYLDGVSESLTPNGTLADIGDLDNSSSAYIGSSQTDVGQERYADGSIADPRIYKRALSADQIASLASMSMGATNLGTRAFDPLFGNDGTNSGSLVLSTKLQAPIGATVTDSAITDYIGNSVSASGTVTAAASPLKARQTANGEWIQDAFEE